MKIEFSANNEEIIYHTSTLNVMLWGILYDFMAFCSQIYSTSSTPRACKVQLQYEISTRPIDDFAFKSVRQCMLQIASESTYVFEQYNEIEMSDSENDESDSTQSSDNNDDESNNNESSDSEEEEEVIEQYTRCNRMSVYPSITSRPTSVRKIRKMNNNESVSVKQENN